MGTDYEHIPKLYVTQTARSVKTAQCLESNLSFFMILRIMCNGSCYLLINIFIAIRRLGYRQDD